MRRVIHRFKYGRKTRLGPRLARLLYTAWLQSPELLSTDVVIAAPLHWRRQQTRGFNQSKILAQQFARMAGVPFEKRALARIRNTPSQTGLTPRQRRLNMTGAFKVRRSEAVRDRACLLIDDVYTTGATLNEMAGILKAAGAKKVFALTLARVSPLAMGVAVKKFSEEDSK